MTYEQALAYIHSRNKFGIKLGLDRMRALLALFGNPHQKYPALHIAGTNGKGSTTAIVRTVMEKAGYKVGSFTSPHLSSYCERLSINGRPIQPARLAALVSEVQPVLEEAALDPEISHPTEFEVGTLLAFKYFAEEQVDLAIFEVGMGGRLDATNVITPLACGITHIALDHQEYLGPDLVSIAKEKAGIIKHKCPVVVAPQEPEVFAVFESTANALKAPLYAVGQAINYEVTRVDLTGTYLQLQWEEEEALSLRLNLFGAHQAANAAVAFGLLQVLKAKGLSWSASALEEGFATVTWPGRLEYLPGPPSILLDGAHNIDGVNMLGQGINCLFPDRPVQALIGSLNNRPVEELAALFVSSLGHNLKQVYATTVPDPKAASAARITQAFQKHGVKTVEIPEPTTALATAQQNLPPEELLVVAGSLYLVGALRPLIIGV
ncbi:MAG: bifunctional folylpolyglutamate synthase/dihydrofolate synthase [Firmicutes bacterium]|nr:bifunctional folylpolyglutamate synthase/dihydrofolate synthase [Bacillota bacterium]